MKSRLRLCSRQAESGTSVAEIIRKLGISQQTFYRWKKRFAGLGIGELRRLRILEEENKKAQAVGRSSANACSERVAVLGRLARLPDTRDHARHHAPRCQAVSSSRSGRALWQAMAGRDESAAPQADTPHRCASHKKCRWLVAAGTGLPLRRIRVLPLRPDRHEPRVRKRRPKNYPLMTKPRAELMQALSAQRLKP